MEGLYSVVVHILSVWKSLLYFDGHPSKKERNWLLHTEVKLEGHIL